MKNALPITKEQNYADWYLEVIKAADLAEHSPTRGCMVIKPWGFAIWERLQADFDRRFKETGHQNAYFPLLIPLSYMEREAEHVDGFAKECAVVTHHRLEQDGEGGLKPAGELTEPYIIRPTSETIIGDMYAKWVNSYRDLPILINQWCNVFRWEMRTRLFLRTAEFLWQEGHTAHATSEEAVEETLQMLQVYKDCIHEMMAMYVIDGEKTPEERFPGAVNTYTVEAMMQDQRALQAGTSHFLGQKFAKAAGIQFTDKDGEQKHAWTTSWGVSTRLIGGLIMTHSDNDGLVLPPALAPKHVTINPIIRKGSDAEKILAYCESIQASLNQQTWRDEKVRVQIDDRDVGAGEKFWSSIKKGIPIRIEVGEREMDAGQLSYHIRTSGSKDKITATTDEFAKALPDLLSQLQNQLFEASKTLCESNTIEVDSVEALEQFFTSGKKGFVTCFCAFDDETQVLRTPVMKKLKISARCLPLANESEQGDCIFSGKLGRKVIFAAAY